MSPENTIAIIGAGKAGKELLSILLQIPGIAVKYVCDIDESAPGIKLARRNDIQICLDSEARQILEDSEIEMIFEVTGNNEVFEYLQREKQPNCNIMCASMAKVIFFLLNAQQEVTGELRRYKLKLAEKVIERTDELEQVNIELKKQVEIQQGLNRKLQEINDEKTKYLLNATHQLKAPFAAIQSYADILIEGYADEISEKALSILVKIKDRCKLLSRSIRKMLELANLKSMVEENIEMEMCDLQVIIGEVIDADSAILEKRNITAIFDRGPIPAEIFCNRDQIKTLIEILFDNAVNYSYDNSSVEVSLFPDSGNRIVLSICDKGIGIEGKNTGKIFNEYFRSYDAVKHNQNGTGLGLPIARKIARLHQSEILVESEPGKGSTFMVAFNRG